MMDCYLPTEGSEVLTRATSWVNLENMLKEARLRRTYIVWFCFSRTSGTGRFIDTESRERVLGLAGWGTYPSGWQDLALHGCRVSVWSGGRVLELGHFGNRDTMVVHYAYN